MMNGHSVSVVSPTRMRWSWVVGLLPAACALSPSFLVMVTGLRIFWWSGPMLIAAGAVVEGFGGTNSSNPSAEQIRALNSVRAYRWCMYAFIPLNLAGMLIACHMWVDPALSGVDRAGLVLTVGLMAGFAINVAHELGHGVGRSDEVLSKVATAQVAYAHFYAEHNRGHHVRVATPEDAVSARFGEGYWAFLVRSSWGEFTFALAAERDRLARKGLRFLSWRNSILQGWVLTALLWGAAVMCFGVSALVFLVLQAVVAIAFLECVNYIEHYGLLRARRPDGRYVRCGPQHSWNSTRALTGLATFHLQRHSDHHIHPGRPYQSLRIEEAAPLLPGGYGQMVFAALVPPLWRKVMDPRVLTLYGGDHRLTNLTPKLRRLHGPSPVVPGDIVSRVERGTVETGQPRGA